MSELGQGPAGMFFSALYDCLQSVVMDSDVVDVCCHVIEGAALQQNVRIQVERRMPLELPHDVPEPLVYPLHYLLQALNDGLRPDSDLNDVRSCVDVAAQWTAASLAEPASAESASLTEPAVALPPSDLPDEWNAYIEAQFTALLSNPEMRELTREKFMQELTYFIESRDRND